MFGWFRAAREVTTKPAQNKEVEASLVARREHAVGDGATHGARGCCQWNLVD